ncbi:class I SAM-dependent methyltransferase [Gilvimarinus sp. 1_MG-2023]|uniref:class I SAM-dependent methyltransferase n=1 Tax=Gilvimarinus sp. 1_MG-2023 TaxID=3062638 RepID=UPI0026E3906F|nr:class I SAM-dependent methyltransferase [Gilvimarinus sp. 1_MG-2023]MDO6747132.1 class I SAM-dependent methyltransferase [Gilvimarinus sp. 1_MG-2023]
MSYPIIVCNHKMQYPQAARMSELLGVELLSNIQPSDLTHVDFALVYDHTGVALAYTGRKAPGPIRCDFASGAVNHRRQFGGGKGQMIAKACGISAHVMPRVLDATAGLGRDAFVLATLGCDVQLLERNPVVHALLQDGLSRAEISADATLAAIIGRMQLLEADARLFMTRASKADVVYLDPMFPERQKAAQVKKEMQAFHTLVGGDQDADELLQQALGLARYRVVVKRPRKAPNLADTPPSYTLEGKTSRFDIYALCKLPGALNDGSHAKNDTVD